MDYERIHKVQGGTRSPTKIRLKLLGSQNKRKEGGSDSSRTSPTKFEDSEFARNSLLKGDGEELCEPCASNDLEECQPHYSSIALTNEEGFLDSSPVDQKEVQTKESEPVHFRVQNSARLISDTVGSNSNLDLVHHSVRNSEDYNEENTNYSSFEFYKEEKGGQKSSLGPLTRTSSSSSKWVDAEKWVINKPRVQYHPTINTNPIKKNSFQGQVTKQSGIHATRVAPEAMASDQKVLLSHILVTKKFDSELSVSEVRPPVHIERTSGAATNQGQYFHYNGVETSNSEVSAAVKSVCMRDMGTEMTPSASQEPSRTGTPTKATTPIRSPVSSLPSTPGRAEPASSPRETTGQELAQNLDYHKRELSERELHLKTRREIMALGMQLGKMNIAAWASKEEEDHRASESLKTMDESELLERMFRARASEWEEAENTKHNARYKREEIKIQTWEAHQKAKTEAEMRRIEIQLEQMRARAYEKLMNKLAAARREAEEKRENAEAKRNQQVIRAARQADHIRHTGRIPVSLLCCSWFTRY
ncbi:hypothetical protein AMTRI_Chr02g254580 [Amborella trichopoda]